MFLDRMFGRKFDRPDETTALGGREEQIDCGSHHFVSGISYLEPYPDTMEIAMFGMGCFWGVERKFWQLDGVYVTAVGYAGGYTPNATYKEVCSGMTDHNEVVRVVFDPSKISYMQLLKTFWEEHDPTQGNRQGNDVGTQYRSGIYTYSDEQKRAAEETRDLFQRQLAKSGINRAITTEIVDAPQFYFAEEYHQQYLAKNPLGYCGVGGTGVSCPVGTGVTTES